MRHGLEPIPTDQYKKAVKKEVEYIIEQSTRQIIETPISTGKYSTTLRAESPVIAEVATTTVYNNRNVFLTDAESVLQALSNS